MKRNDAGRIVKRCAYLAPTDKLVFLMLLEGADNTNCTVPDYMTPTTPELAVWTSLSLATVKRSIRHLELHGWLQRDPGRGRGRKSTYGLVPREPDACCGCEKVSLRALSDESKGVTPEPFMDTKGVTGDKKRGHLEQEKGSDDLGTPQVSPAIVGRDSREGREQYQRCDRCESTNTQIVGMYRLCKVHAGAQWKESA